MRRLFIFLLFISFVFCSGTIIAATSSFKLGICRIGGDDLSAANDDADELAKWDVIMYNRYHYNDDPGAEATTAANIKSINPDAVIYCYQASLHTNHDGRGCGTSYSTNLGRYSDADGYCGHSMGDIEDLTSIHLITDGLWAACLESSNCWLDPGDSNTDDYVAEAIIYDLDAMGDCDGIYVDHILTSVVTSHFPGGFPDDYPNDAAWGTAMNTFVNGVVPKVNTGGYLFGGNLAQCRTNAQAITFQNMDNLANPPDMIFMEDTFVLVWGWGDANFNTPAEWINEIESIAAAGNITHVVINSHSKLTRSIPNGTDNYSDSVNFYDVVWYAMGSYLISKNSNTYMMFDTDTLGESYNELDGQWLDEYDYIELGSPDGAYYTKVVDGTNLYIRKYDFGYVIVNPGTVSLSNVDYSTDLELTGTFREITHDNMTTNPWTDIGTSTQFASFPRHRAKILYSATPTITGATPINGATGQVTTTDINWTNPGVATGINLYFDKKADHDPPTTLVVNNSLVETYDCGTLLEGTDYVYRADVVHAGGTATGTLYYFITTTGPPPPPAGLSIIKHNSLGLTGVYDDQGATVGE